MQTLPPDEMRNLATGQGNEVREVIPSSNGSDNSETLRLLQATSIIARFPVSVPVALTVARLAFGGAA